MHEWYLAVYVDAIEWVELPNTLGMSQYGDGGIMDYEPPEMEALHGAADTGPETAAGSEPALSDERQPAAVAAAVGQEEAAACWC